MSSGLAGPNGNCCAFFCVPLAGFGLAGAIPRFMIGALDADGPARGFMVAGDRGTFGWRGFPLPRSQIGWQISSNPSMSTKAVSSDSSSWSRGRTSSKSHAAAGHPGLMGADGHAGLLAAGFVAPAGFAAPAGFSGPARKRGLTCDMHDLSRCEAKQLSGQNGLLRPHRERAEQLVNLFGISRILEDHGHVAVGSRREAVLARGNDGALARVPRLKDLTRLTPGTHALRAQPHSVRGNQERACHVLLGAIVADASPRGTGIWSLPAAVRKEKARMAR
eukprot:scaffold97913_cov66-Phaeocystis_antarctica.AAC.3